MRLVSVVRGIAFLLRNVWLARFVPPVCEETIEPGLRIMGCEPQWVRGAINLYREINGDQTLGLFKRWVLYATGRRLSFALIDDSRNEVVGLGLYYFNARDLRDGTVHEGFTGIAPYLRGRGIGTKLRRHALRHFARTSFIRGVSSRVSLNNPASLVSNINLGFKERERYFDPILEVERVYLVCDLAPYRSKNDEKME